MNRTINASLMSIAAQLIRLFGGLVFIKLVVGMQGPESLGKLGHFMNIFSILIVFAGGGISNGIIKYVAEYEREADKLKYFLSVSRTYATIISLAIFLLLTIFAKSLSLLLFHTEKYWDLMIFLGTTQSCLAYINFVNGVFNGQRKTSLYARIVLIGSFIGLLPIYFLIKNYQIDGAVVALVSLQIGMVLPAWYFYKKYVHLKTNYLFDWAVIKKLSKFSGMQMISFMTMPLAEMFIRNQLVAVSGWESAGIWQGIQRVSSAYLSVYLSFLLFYYMPMLSSLSSKKDTVAYAVKMLKIITLASLIAGLVLYNARDIVYPLLLSDDIMVSAQLLLCQIIGDFFRILSYVIGLVIMAKAALKCYLLAEILQVSLFVGFFMLSTKYCGASGVYLGYAIAYLLYFIISLLSLGIYSTLEKVYENNRKKLR